MRRSRTVRLPATAPIRPARPVAQRARTSRRLPGRCAAVHAAQIKRESQRCIKALAIAAPSVSALWGQVLNLAGSGLEYCTRAIALWGQVLNLARQGDVDRERFGVQDSRPDPRQRDRRQRTPGSGPQAARSPVFVMPRSRTGRARATDFIRSVRPARSCRGPRWAETHASVPQEGKATAAGGLAWGESRRSGAQRQAQAPQARSTGTKAPLDSTSIDWCQLAQPVCLSPCPP